MSNSGEARPEKQIPSPPDYPSSTPILPGLSNSSGGVGSSDEPPPYVEDAALVEDALVPADTLFVADKSIYGAAGGPEAPALYELDKNIGLVRNFQKSLELSRLERRVRHGSEVVTRSRCIFELAHPPDTICPPFPFHAEPRLRGGRSVGYMGMLPFSDLRTGGYRFFRAEGKALVQREQMFEAVRSTRKHQVRMGSYEWYAFGPAAAAVVRSSPDGVPSSSSSSSFPPSAAAANRARSGSRNGVLVAQEDTESETTLHRLVVLVAMDQPTRDALVAAWCLRLWEDIGERSAIEIPSVSVTKRSLKVLFRGFGF